MWFDRIRRRYVHVLKGTIRHRYVVVCGVFAVGILVSIGAFSQLERQLFPGEDFPQFYIKAEMPPSFGLKETSATLAKVEEVAMSLPSDERIAVVTNIGLVTPTSLQEGSSIRSNVGEVLVELTPKDQRVRSTDEIIADLRGKVDAISGIEKLTFDAQQGGPPQGSDVEVKVKGERFEPLEKNCQFTQRKITSDGRRLRYTGRFCYRKIGNPPAC